MHTLPSRDPKRELDSENFAHASMYWHYLFFLLKIFFGRGSLQPRMNSTRLNLFRSEIFARLK